MKIQTKRDCKKVFGTYTAMAEWMGLTRAAISKWPDNLTQRQIDEVTGAIIRKKRQTLLDLQSCDDDLLEDEDSAK